MTLTPSLTLPINTPLGDTFSTHLCQLRHRNPVSAEPGLNCCQGHLSGIADQLEDARFLYDQLDDLAVPGPSTEEHHRGKHVASKPPLRLDILVLRDLTRSVPSEGVYPMSILVEWSARVGRERLMQPLHSHDVTAAITRLRLQVRWIAAASWFELFADDLRNVGASLRQAAGDCPRPRVGSCFLPVTDDDTAECAGALIMDKHGGMGVSCVKCGARWTEAEISKLGPILRAG